jgi:hypothetical protein
MNGMGFIADIPNQIFDNSATEMYATFYDIFVHNALGITNVF